MEDLKDNSEYNYLELVKIKIEIIYFLWISKININYANKSEYTIKIATD